MTFSFEALFFLGRKVKSSQLHQLHFNEAPFDWSEKYFWRERDILQQQTNTPSTFFSSFFIVEAFLAENQYTGKKLAVLQMMIQMEESSHTSV